MDRTASHPHRFRVFNRVLVGLCLTIFAAVMIFNLSIDPYNVFGLSTLKNGYTDNERYNKVRRILGVPSEFDAFIVGSSRMGLYDPGDLERLRPGRRYYNLAVFGGHAADAHRMLEALVAGGADVAEIVMGIDIFPFLEQDEEITPAYRHHPLVTGQSFASFYTGYLFVPSVTHAVLKLQQNRREIPDIVFDFDKTGRYYLTAWDHRIEVDHEAFMADTFDVSLSEPTRRAVVWNAQRFAELATFSAWLRATGIPAYFYIQPHHASELENYTAETLTTFRERIHSVLGDIPDFSQHADWSTNNAWYYEPKHYRPALAAHVVTELFVDPTPVSNVAAAHREASALQ